MGGVPTPATPATPATKIVRRGTDIVASVRRMEGVRAIPMPLRLLLMNLAHMLKHRVF